MRRGSDEDPPDAPDVPDDPDPPRSPVAQRHYDPTEPIELTTAIVFTVADAMDVDPRAVSTQPLYECVDVEAVETALFSTEPVSSRCEPDAIEFGYVAFRIRVQRDGWILVFEPADESSPE
jgi:hypothetical protein